MSHDLNIRLKSSRDSDKVLLIKRLLELGWDTIAWNHNVVGKVTANNIKIVKPIVLESKKQLKDAKKLRSLCTNTNKNHINATAITQLNRITLTIDDVIDASCLNTSNELLRKYDIVAACPGNLSVFAYLCKTAEIDVISIDFSHKLSFTMNKKLLDEAIRRGIYFEIQYSCIISTNSNIRRDTIANTKVFIEYLKGKNVILSSGCDVISMIRAPIDVVNLGRFLKIRQEMSLKCISENCILLLKHAELRKRKGLSGEVLSMQQCTSRWPDHITCDNHSIVKASDANTANGDDDDDESDDDGDDSRKRKHNDDNDDESDDESDDEVEEDNDKPLSIFF